MTRSEKLATLARRLRQAIWACAVGIVVTVFVAYLVVTNKLNPAEPRSASIAAGFLIFVLCCCVSARVTLSRLWRKSPHPVGHCQDCGYDLSGQRSAGRSPECGSEYIIRQSQ
ncbi:MAG: hypothetical protein IT434_01460 [Phycisphaerales bacterium]|jgi:hypothetical protein|nr:hypothetical protein [Phycisphaerales bacterium]